MKKKKHKPARKQAGKPSDLNVRFDRDPGYDPAKRGTLMKFGNTALGIVALGGIGYWSVNGIQACAAEMDLTRIGNGIPSIVQIHDPTCPTCMALQKEARAALARMEEEKVQYLVANIRTAYGRKFANGHGVGHVTLLLFDGDGRMTGKLEGARDRDELLTAFEVHLRNNS